MTRAVYETARGARRCAPGRDRTARLTAGGGR